MDAGVSIALPLSHTRSSAPECTSTVFFIFGSLACGCNIGYSVGVGCNSTTGLCECLPGVVGDKCDTCPHRWVLIPNEGCFTCDNCTHGLLDVTDRLQADFDPINRQFQVSERASTCSFFFGGGGGLSHMMWNHVFLTFLVADCGRRLFHRATFTLHQYDGEQFEAQY